MKSLKKNLDIYNLINSRLSDKTHSFTYTYIMEIQRILNFIIKDKFNYFKYWESDDKDAVYTE